MCAGFQYYSQNMSLLENTSKFDKINTETMEFTTSQ